MVNAARRVRRSAARLQGSIAWYSHARYGCPRRLRGLQALSLALLTQPARYASIKCSKLISFFWLVCYRPLGSVASLNIGPHACSDCI